MITVPLSMLVRQADAILWVRKAGGDAGSAGELRRGRSAGRGRRQPSGETEVRIVPGDYDTLAVFTSRRFRACMSRLPIATYPGQARGDEPEGCIVFLRRYRLGMAWSSCRRLQGARARQQAGRDPPRCCGGNLASRGSGQRV